MKTKVRNLDGEERLRREAAYHPADAEIRRRGYKIWARPGRGPAVWVKDGVLYVQTNCGSISLEPKE